MAIKVRIAEDTRYVVELHRMGIRRRLILVLPGNEDLMVFDLRSQLVPVAKPPHHLPDDDVDVLNATEIELALFAIRRLLRHDPLQNVAHSLLSIQLPAVRPANRA